MKILAAIIGFLSSFSMMGMMQYQTRLNQARKEQPWARISTATPLVQYIKNPKIYSLLIKAAQKGELEKIKVIFGQNIPGVTPVIRDKHGKTLQMIAAEKGHKEVADYLAQKEQEYLRQFVKPIQVEKSPRDENSPQKSWVYEYAEGLDLPIEVPERIVVSGEMIQDALEKGDVNLLSALLKKFREQGGDINTIVDAEKNSLLLTAFKKFNEAIRPDNIDTFMQIMKLLVDNGADVTRKNMYNNTVLLKAVTAAKLTLLQDFIIPALQKIQRVDTINDAGLEGRTPLMIAAKNGLAPIVKLLLDNGADTALKDSQNKMALEYAIENGNRDSILYLMNKSPLSNEELAKQLFKYRNALKLKENETLVDLARAAGNTQLEGIFRAAGIKAGITGWGWFGSFFK